MAVVERVLLGTGPSYPYPEATAALAAPSPGHLDPDLLVARALVEEAVDTDHHDVARLHEGDERRLRAGGTVAGDRQGAGVPGAPEGAGLLGHGARPANVTLLLAALAEVLGR